MSFVPVPDAAAASLVELFARFVPGVFHLGGFPVGILMIEPDLFVEAVKRASPKSAEPVRWVRMIERGLWTREEAAGFFALLLESAATPAGTAKVSRRIARGDGWGYLFPVGRGRPKGPSAGPSTIDTRVALKRAAVGLRVHGVLDRDSVHGVADHLASVLPDSSPTLRLKIAKLLTADERMSRRLDKATAVACGVSAAEVQRSAGTQRRSK